MPDPSSFDYWFNKNYLGQAKKMFGEHLDPNMNLQFRAYRDSLKDDYESYKDDFSKQQDRIKLGSEYDEASSALGDARTADVNEFQSLAPMAQRKLLGSLNSRGLGSSVAAGGAGSGYMSSLANRQASTLGDIELGYQNLGQNLANRKKAGQIGISDFYNDLGFAKEQARGKKADFFDFLGGIIGGAKDFL
jgi:hypothetical protein